jgi:hypothetical protein
MMMMVMMIMMIMMTSLLSYREIVLVSTIILNLTTKQVGYYRTPARRRDSATVAVAIH